MPREKYRPELVTRAAFARRTGRTKAAVTLACRGPLAPALVGRQIDAAHPAAKLYAEQAAATPTATRPAEPIPPPQPEQRDRTDLLEATMQRRRAELGLLELKLAERRGELISRELVAHHVIGALKRLHLRLLNDLPRAVAGRLSGLDFEQRRKVIYDAISAELTAANSAAMQALRTPDEPAAPIRAPNGSHALSSTGTTAPASTNGSPSAHDGTSSAE
jgi:hypothetical protein